MPNLKFITVPLFLLLIMLANVAAQKMEQSTKEVPKELKDRLELYWKYTQKEDWENLFDILDDSILIKEDYVEMMKKEKNNSYRRLNSTQEVYYENKMSFLSSKEKWQISGCAKVTDKNNKERWLASSTTAFQTEDNEWIISGPAFFFKDSDFVSCNKDASAFPIKIKVSELK
jgi:hypothetical protein